MINVFALPIFLFFRMNILGIREKKRTCRTA